MKKILFSLILLTLTTAFIFAQQNILPRLAVVELKHNIGNENIRKDASAMRNLVESRMVTAGKFYIVTRNDIDRLLVEQKIMASEISSTENREKLQIRNINYIVTGDIDVIGNDYSVTIRMLNVINGQIPHSVNNRVNSQDIHNGINLIMTRFLSGITVEDDRILPLNQNNRTYKIGDTGPGGGIIFFVEGNSYMEVSRLLGDYLWNDAVTTSSNFRGGGYNDWYLPSRSELNLIYQNLQRTGIANLGIQTYWSSTRGESNNTAWYQFNISGAQFEGKLNTAYSVRAIRAF
ncbi:MAG: DUF1566 domain-containing protein [Treponema sp.]|nr:DUF1566 domain-containing protein [Treponema sp.]